MTIKEGDCCTDGHLISFVPGSKREVLPEELGQRIDDASGEGFVGCLNCRVPADQIDHGELKIPAAG